MENLKVRDEPINAIELDMEVEELEQREAPGIDTSPGIWNPGWRR